jgi:hypothetical protein
VPQAHGSNSCARPLVRTGPGETIGSGAYADELSCAGCSACVGDTQPPCDSHARRRGNARFNELRKEVDGISQRMLTVTLRGLERDGLVARSVSGNPALGGVCPDTVRA